MSVQISSKHFHGAMQTILQESPPPPLLHRAFLARVEIESTAATLFLDVLWIDYAFISTYVKRVFIYKCMF